MNDSTSLLITSFAEVIFAINGSTSFAFNCYRERVTIPVLPVISEKDLKAQRHLLKRYDISIFLIKINLCG
jgi:hypothetical protein